MDMFENVLVDDALLEGAANAVHVCLRIRPDEKVTLITDTATLDIAACLHQEILKIGAACRVFVLEDFGPRPHEQMPQEILEDLQTSAVSLYAVLGQPGELRTRMQMTAVVTRNRLRHAHMINITRQIMMDGMRADFRKVDELSSRVHAVVASATAIRATSSRGTDIRATFSPQLRWLKTSGIISTEKWGNLPGGEVFTSPWSVSGTFVVDGVVGDYLCKKYGDLKDTPLTIEIRDSRIVSAASSNRELEREFHEYCHTDENSDRVGEFAIGTNTHLRHVIGNILQDEKIPGVHIAFGHPYAEHTGAQWHSTTHIDVVGTGFSIWADSRQIMDDGRFLI